jgi:hypothetical protein
MPATYRSVGANEGQMRELIGYLVASGGAEDAAAWMAAGISQRVLCRQFVCKHFLCEQVIRRQVTHARTDTVPTNSILTDNVLTDSVGTGSPITIIYSRESFADDAIEEIASAIPDPSVFDCGSRAAQAAGGGARRT